MNRRYFITAAGATIVAGCSQDSGQGASSGAATATPTQTPEPASGGSSRPEAPEILAVNLISDFQDYGDVERNAISSAPRGSDIIIGYQHRTWVHDGEFSITAEVRIFDAGGTRVAVNSDQDEQLVEGHGPATWNGALPFRADRDPGEFTAEVIIRDDVTDMVSEPETGSFEITQPEPKLEVISHQAYRGRYDSGVRGIARNTSDEPLSYAEVSVVFLDAQGRQLSSSQDVTTDLAPGREWRFDVVHLAQERFSSYEIGTDWRV